MAEVKNRMRHILLLTALTAVMTLQGAKTATGYYFVASGDAVFDSITHVLSQKDFDNERQAVDPTLLDRLDQLAQQRRQPLLEARALYWRVRTTQMSAPPPQCIERLERAQQLITDARYDYDLALIRYQLAGNCERMGQYMKTYELLSEAIPTLHKYGDDYFLGNAYLLKGQLLLNIDDRAAALEQIRLSRESYERAHYPLNRIYFFEAMAKSDDTSLDLYRRSVATGGKDWGMTLQGYANISNIFLARQQPDSALVYINQGYELLREKSPDNPLFYSILAIDHVRVLYQQRQYEQALDVLRSLEPFAKWLEGERMMETIYEYLWRVNDKLERRDDAYKYLRRYQEEYARSEANIRRAEIPKAQAREAIARQQDQIRLLEQDAQLSRNRLYASILVTVLLVVAAAGVAVWFYQRNRLRRQENRELRKSLEQEAIISQLNRQNFENDIKQKDCEISSSTLLLANKNEVLQQLHDITERFGADGRIPHEYVRQVNNVIGESLRNDDEWSRFKLHFDSVHPDFFLKLKEQASDLTENELRLCAYIRIGMRAKQIAEMLSVTPDSVNTARYRLRKKLGLERGEKLDDYIRRV